MPNYRSSNRCLLGQMSKKYSFMPEAKAKPPSKAKAPPRQIPEGAVLTSLKAASIALNDRYDGGYSVRTLRRLITNGTWKHDWHWTRTGRLIKIYLPAAQEYQDELNRRAV
jgi:hypothetical protein